MSEPSKDKQKREKRRFTFEEEVEALFERHGFVDYALVVRSVDSVTRALWVAGDGQNPAGDRERALVLYGEMGCLQASICAYHTPKTNPLP